MRDNEKKGIMQSRLLPILIIPLLSLNACSKDEDRWGDCDWDSAPTATTPACDPRDPLPAPAATTPEILFANLAHALRTQDKDLYESLIDWNYWFTETNCLGDTLFENGFEEELKIMGGSRDGSNEGIFDIFRDFNYDLHLFLRSRNSAQSFSERLMATPTAIPMKTGRSSAVGFRC